MVDSFGKLPKCQTLDKKHCFAVEAWWKHSTKSHCRRKEVVEKAVENMFCCLCCQQSSCVMSFCMFAFGLQVECVGLWAVGGSRVLASLLKLCFSFEAACFCCCLKLNLRFSFEATCVCL